MEPNVVKHYVSVMRIPPGGVQQPIDENRLPLSDPGPNGPDGGTPWRGLAGLERALMFLIHKGARKHVGMSVAFPELAARLPASSPGPSASLVDPATRTLLEVLQRSEVLSRARELHLQTV